MIWIETPANPILRLTDIAALAAIAKRHDVPLAVDSTFATPVATRPVEHGADFVVHSLTKYIGGHGDALGGAVLGTKERLESLRTRALVYFGGVLSPFNAWLIAPRRGDPADPHARPRGRGGPDRPVPRGSSRGLARELPRPRVPPPARLGPAPDGQHVGHLVVPGSRDGAALAERMAKDLEIIHYAVSLGHHRSLIYWIDTDAMMESTFELAGKQLAHYRE